MTRQDYRNVQSSLRDARWSARAAQYVLDRSDISEETKHAMKAMDHAVVRLISAVKADYGSKT